LQTHKVTKGVKPEAIVVYCSQADLQAPFQEFIEETLFLPKGRHIPHVVAGGAGVLARPDILPDEFGVTQKRLEFFLGEAKSVRRIVLISHEDCLWYDKWLSATLGFAQPPEQAFEDLKLMPQIFATQLAHLGVQPESYYARYAGKDRERLQFERVQ
jgi:hypothetical protein